MKVLTIKQPWASLIAGGVKDIENRTWKTNYRGRILIHAGAQIFNPERVTLTDEQLELCQKANKIGKLPNTDCLPYSAIIGEVDIVDCVLNHPSIWADRFFRGDKPIWNWELANPVLYDEPILNVKGRLSFWEYKEGIS